jgi:hypothetical protein
MDEKIIEWEHGHLHGYVANELSYRIIYERLEGLYFCYSNDWKDLGCDKTLDGAKEICNAHLNKEQ